MEKCMHRPAGLAFGSFSALMTARSRSSVCILALYVARICGVSCSGIQVRAPMGSDSVYRNGLWPRGLLIRQPLQRG